MVIPLSAALLFGFILLAAFRGSQIARTLGASEESAHRAATERRKRNCDNRRERRWPVWPAAATVSVLGEPERPAPCRIVNASRSGLRIAAPRNFANGIQLHVQRGDEFFIGAVCYTFAREGEWVAGLELVSSNYSDGWEVLLPLRRLLERTRQLPAWAAVNLRLAAGRPD